MENEIKYSEEIEKVVNQKNTECALYGTRECRFVNAESCSECSIGSLAPEKQVKTREALGRLLENVSEKELERLYTSDKCLLCKGGEKGEASCFALFDLAKRDEKGDWTIGLGKKRIGMKAADMVLPLQVSACKKCRRAHRLFDCLPAAVGVVIAAAGLLLTTDPAFHKKAYDVAAWLPAAVMAGFVIVGCIAAAIIRKAIASSAAKRMHIDAGDIPEVAELISRGFYEVAEKKSGMSHMVFANTRREHGVGSLVTGEGDGEDEKPEICGIWPAEHFEKEKE